MPTLEELFKTKKLDTGQTAEKKYDIRNSKEDKPTSASPLMNAIGFPLQQIARRNLSARTKETFLEEEVTGLRILNKASSPILYGTDILRLSTQTTRLKEEMQSAAKGSRGNGLLTKTLDKINTFVNTAGAKLGIPTTYIPTRITLNSDFQSTNVLSSASTLKKIKEGSEGKFWGKLIKQGGIGNPSEVGSQLVGGAIQQAKNQLKDNLLGKFTAYNPTITPKKSTKFVLRRTNWNKNRTPLDNLKRLTYNDVQQEAPDAQINPTEFFGIGLFQYNYKFGNYDNTLGGDGTIYSRQISPAATTFESRNDLSTKYDIISPLLLPEKRIVNELSNIKNVYSKNGSKRLAKNIAGNKLNKTIHDIENKLGIQSGSGDFYNTKTAYAITKDATSLQLADNTYLDSFDFVVLKFISVATSTAVNFRATITGLTETFAPTWDSKKFIGNPFSFYTYTGIDRSVQFNFKVYSLTDDEHIAAWERLQFLTGLTYPQKYSTLGYTIPPFLKFTLGNMYLEKECFIDSLIYTIDDNYPWEIGIDDKTKDYKLPKIIDVGITLKFVETRGTTSAKRKYGFGGTNNETQNQFEKDYSISTSGVGIPVDRKLIDKNVSPLKILDSFKKI
jgi:hypothetical protein